MPPRARRVIIILLLLLLAAIAVLFGRCSRVKSPAPKNGAAAEPGVAAHSGPPATSAAQPAEVLAPATLSVPAHIMAGAAFRAEWTGPNNPGDYLTIVRPGSAAAAYQNYRETREGATLELTAPVEAGEWEVRYVTLKSKTILARAPLTVTASAAALSAPDEVVLGTPVSITWSGPNNAGDFVTIVPKNAPDQQIGNSADTAKGSPLVVNAPVDPGEAEVRYISGQGRKVLGRRKLIIVMPEVSVVAQNSVVAGARFPVTWKGPANSGDYITVVPKATPDGQYRNYTDVAKNPTIELTAPMEIGDAEIRYMTGSQARVLARRSIAVTAADITLQAAEQIVAGARAEIAWTGPNNSGDYLTIVPKTTPDGQYGNYVNTSKGSPLSVPAPMRAGDAEIRYMSGQGARVLARRPIAIIEAAISLQAPADAAPGSAVQLEWTGPNNAGDYITVAPKLAKDGVAPTFVYTARGSPTKLTMPKEPGAYEIRYMSGQGNLVLGRSVIQVR
jgi:Ca-activated chloride channel homolog